jgi:hypothetical protein
MTKDEILNMPAGEEIDILIAREVFHSPELWFRGNVVRDKTKWYCGPSFSRDINATSELIDKMHQYEYQYTLRGYFMGVERHVATFDNQAWADANPLYKAHGDTAQLAICRAALLAMLGK